MKTILVSVDFSSATRAVVEAALELGGVSAARYILHHSLMPPVITTEYGIGLEMLQETIEIGRKSALHQLEHLEDELTARGIDVSTELSDGAAAPHILDLAASKRVDTIVLGSHGHSAIYDLLLGSTTHAVLQKATCPVLIVPVNSTALRKKKKKKK